MGRKLMALPVCGMLALGGLAGCTDRPLPAEGTGAGVVLSLIDSDLSSAAIDYTLTSFDIATRTLSGVSKLATVCDNLSPVDPCRFRFTAELAAGTGYFAARLERYIPTDPCRTLAASYNAVAVGDDTSFNSAIAALTAQGCKARIVLDATAATIRWFQPVP